ncbi:Isoprenoid synthase domain superfamily [Arabidopsis suecica]|uniref:Isoprenoid synthase domain superfamily n=1 Tax=Arabidopsis suecica TaxID=45249 RepID=A0A8T2BP06_ARASU|nr:Isoprenoid synthase domain superfamily [Arabidopsis suecica]
MAREPFNITPAYCCFSYIIFTGFLFVFKLILIGLINNKQRCYIELFTNSVSVANVNVKANVSASDWRIGFAAKSPVPGCKISLRTLSSRLLRGDQVISNSSSWEYFGEFVPQDKTNIVFEKVVMPKLIGDMIWNLRVDIMYAVKTDVRYINGLLMADCPDIPVKFTTDAAGNVMGTLLGNARFEIDEEYQKTAVLKQMGCLWRSWKSRLVTKVRQADTNQQRMKLRPKNVSPFEWRKLVKIKTSKEFKVVSDSYKERRSKQIPHTTSRKGMVRLAEDMKKESSNPSEVSRLKVWIKSRTRKDGTPVNTNAAEKIREAAEIVKSDTAASTCFDGQDSLSQLLGPDNPCRMRAMGRNMNKTKLACFQVKNKCMAEMEAKQTHLLLKVNELEDVIEKLKNQRQEPDAASNSAARSVNKRSQPKCILIDWTGNGDAIVAEGRIITSDPDELVNDCRLGPSDVKVLVDTATVPNAYLWRPALNMCTIESAIGQIIAWPASKCVNIENEQEPEDIEKLSQRTNSAMNKCKLLDLSADDVVVAEGRWQTQDRDALVNGLPLGPNAVKIFVDVVCQPETFIWRPTIDVTYLEDCLQTFVSWPVNKVVFQNPTDAIGQQSPIQKAASTQQCSGGKSAATAQKSVGTSQKTAPTVSKPPTEKSPPSGQESPIQQSQRPTLTVPLRRSPRKTGAEAIKENKKCKLMDISGKKQIVAEGRVNSVDPDIKVHCVRLGLNAARVWVDIVKIDDAAVWRPSAEIEYMRDALGSAIAWPMDKLPVKTVGLVKTTIKACGDGVSLRTFKKLPPSEWGHHFLTVPIDLLEINAMAREIDELKRKVKGMLMPSQGVNETKKRMIFIYLLVSLGLACHFVDEIYENLKHGFEAREEIMSGEDDLYTVSTIFWLFRTYGYNMSCDVFKRFRRKDGMFKECLVGDAKGMLSLYEAAHLETTRTEKILDEALRGGGTIPPHISRLIKNSLYIPQRHNIEMWWKEQDLASKLPPYFKDRMVECYLYSFAIQPQFSHMELAYKWLKARPKFVRALARKARLLNDMTGFEDDMSRGDEVNVVNYYMKEHNVSKEETLREFNKMIRETNKSQPRLLQPLLFSLFGLTGVYGGSTIKITANEENVAKDLELFAHHAGRKGVNMDDVVLSGRNCFSLTRSC